MKMAFRSMFQVPANFARPCDFLRFSRFQSTQTRPARNETEAELKFNQEYENVKPLSEMPGPKSVPVLGTAWRLLPGFNFDPTRLNLFHEQEYKKYGKIWREKFPQFGVTILTTDPADTETIFRNEGKFPVRPGFDTLKAYRQAKAEQFAASGSLTDQGEKWWRIRSKVQQPMLKPQNTFVYLEPISGVTDEFMARIRDVRDEKNEAPADFLNEIYKWALESVALVMLNTRLGCLDPNSPPDSEPQKMINATNDILTTIFQMEVGPPLWRYFSTSTWKKFSKAQDYFTETSLKYINKAVEEIKKRPADADVEPNMLESILSRGLPIADAVVMVIDMLMAGIDTTSNSLAFLMYHLSRNPEKQEKLRQEILSVVPKGQPITTEIISQLPYMKACIKENFRLTPAIGVTARQIKQDLVLSGYRVPKDTMVISLNQLMCRLEEYFPQPDDFVPERWLKGHPLETTAPPYVMLPFGFGGRMCVGRRLAELESWLLIIKLMQNFRIEYHHGDMGFFTRLINVPDKPLKFKFIDLN